MDMIWQKSVFIDRYRDTVCLNMHEKDILFPCLSEHTVCTVPPGQAPRQKGDQENKKNSWLFLRSCSYI